MSAQTFYYSKMLCMKGQQGIREKEHVEEPNLWTCHNLAVMTRGLHLKGPSLHLKLESGGSDGIHVPCCLIHACTNQADEDRDIRKLTHT